MSPPEASSDPMIVGLQETNSSIEEVLAIMDSLKIQVASNRRDYIERRMQENTEQVVEVTKNFKTTCGGVGVDLLANRQQDAVKNVVRPNKLPEVKTIPPPYTTWVFLKRNQRMTDDQSVVSKKCIYYGQTGGEALICSDSEEEAANDEEEKKEFVQSEDYILRKTIEEVGFSDLTLDLLAQCLSRKPCDIKGRYEDLMNNNPAVCRMNNGNVEGVMNPYIDKGLDVAMDSFDSLFCRRCLIFDCRLHGCSQELVFPVEKHTAWSCPDVEKGPCGPNCHLLVLESKAMSARSGRCDEKAAPSSNGATVQGSKDKYGVSFLRRSKRIAEKVTVAEKKRQKKKATSDSDSVAADNLRSTSHRDNEDRNETVDTRTWKPLEIAMYEKGIQVFGRNSCLIARNMMTGLKNCSEISKFMNHSDKKILSHENDGMTLANGCLKDDADEIVVSGAHRRSKSFRCKGKGRRLKFAWKSLRKRISERKDQPCRQYSPCGCKSACGKKCPCLVNDTCCEKYCGCPKSCKNRFRGCHCAKSQCRSRQCPCFAANRECDPDVCRNCWIGCGDGSGGVPSQRGDNYECRNMKLLLKQQQRVLLGRSDVCGWGAFLKNSVDKDAYLGEYTGELVSDHEADYDRDNSSFLFNLNDKFIIDAHRRGDKLKFANHSSEPNCYAKVMMVAGDHRVGIFADERISGGEELFYDYCYEPDQAPAWAKKTDAPGAEREEGATSNGGAKKHT